MLFIQLLQEVIVKMVVQYTFQDYLIWWLMIQHLAIIKFHNQVDQYIYQATKNWL